MMLKKALAAGAVALLITPTMAHAQRKYGMAGCGLGSVVMGPKGSQISAYTTNGTSGSQLYGITTGTSNCQPDRRGAMSEAQESFMFSNYATLSKEMAQGSGTTLAGLAHVLGCGETDQAAFNKVAQTEEVDFMMNISEFEKDNMTWICGVFSKTLIPFYGILTLIILILKCFI